MDAHEYAAIHPQPNGMMIGMTRRAKIAVSLPAEQVDAMRQAVRDGFAPSVSHYVETAIERRRTLDDLDSLLDSLLQRSGGALTDQERADIDRDAGWR